jgi:hypothetical protein
MFSLNRFTATIGIGCALAGAGLAGATSALAALPTGAHALLGPPARPTIPGLPAAPTIPGLPAAPTIPGLPLSPTSCSQNQGLFPGFLNLGPTGPLGPLGAYGPLGTNANLPCGASVFDLGPAGPLGPHGPLGGNQ